MAKECKSCGNYYEGDYCDKCGYGKKPTSSKAAKKYKKATKPERFQTPEEKALYQKWAQEGKKPPKRDPNAGIKTLIIVAIVVIGGIFGVLYSTGAIFSSSKTEVITNYFNSITEGDFDKFVKCYPSQIKNDYEDDRSSAGLSKSDYMQKLYGDFKETYGDDYKIDVEFGRETKLDAEDYDMTEYKEQYGSAPTISEAYEIVVNVTFKGSVSTEDAKLYINVAKTSGSWKIFNITEDNGILEASSGESTGSTAE